MSDAGFTKQPLSPENLTVLLKGQPEFRINQLWDAFFKAPEFSFAGITTLPASLRETLEQSLDPEVFKVQQVFCSKKDQTHKALLSLNDGLSIESVLMPNARGQWTICLSSQVGCAMGCRFCATGTMGQVRSLTAFEIAGQVPFWQRFMNREMKNAGRISNLVFMGMGEPLLNYDSVKLALQKILKLTDIGPNSVTVSTVGLFPHLFRLLEDESWPPVKIALSLHAPVDNLRKSIVPTHQSSYFEELLKWCREYTRTHGARTRPLTVEYVLLGGVNDQEKHARELARLLRPLKRVKVNLIPFNTVPGLPYESCSLKQSEKFQSVLQQMGIQVTIRFSKGQDIAGACGQLATSTRQ